jgi:hypothetical protein
MGAHQDRVETTPTRDGPIAAESGHPGPQTDPKEFGQPWPPATFTRARTKFGHGTFSTPPDPHRTPSWRRRKTPRTPTSRRAAELLTCGPPNAGAGSHRKGRPSADDRFRPLARVPVPRTSLQWSWTTFPRFEEGAIVRAHLDPAATRVPGQVACLEVLRPRSAKAAKHRGA